MVNSTQVEELLATVEKTMERTQCLLSLWNEVHSKAEAHHQSLCHNPLITPSERNESEQNAKVFRKLAQSNESRIMKLAEQRVKLMGLKGILSKTLISANETNELEKMYQNIATEFGGGDVKWRAESKTLSDEMMKETRSMLGDIVIDIMAIGIGITYRQMADAVERAAKEGDSEVNRDPVVNGRDSEVSGGNSEVNGGDPEVNGE